MALSTIFNIYLSDLNISDEVWGQAKSTKILGIDFQRLLKRNIESANVGLSTTSIPSITAINYGGTDFQIMGLTIIDTESLALNDLLNKNKEYDYFFFGGWGAHLVEVERTTLERICPCECWPSCSRPPPQLLRPAGYYYLH